MTRQGRITPAILRKQNNAWLAARLAEDVSNAINPGLSQAQRTRAEHFVELVKAELRRRNIPVDLEEEREKLGIELHELRLQRVELLNRYLLDRRALSKRIAEIEALL